MFADFFTHSAKTADDRKAQTDAARLHAWTVRLHLEYDAILFQYGLKMRPPILLVKAMESRWGEWDASTRRLCINLHLIERYSWDHVLEVLKHEMAHQYVSEVTGVHETAHSAAFRAACERLGVQAWAAEASGELPREIPVHRDRVLGPEEERLLRRAEKLLALANSSNEHEAALAMERVREIYQNHNFERIRAADERRWTYEILPTRKRRIPHTTSMICGILSEHFFVRVIFSSLFDAADLVEYKTIELFGAPENVAMAEYVYGFLHGTIDRLWDDFRRKAGKAGKAGKAKSSFKIGVLQGFQEKLAAQNVAPSSTDSAALRALVKRDEEVCDKFVRQRHPRLARRYWGGGSVDGDSFHAGKEEGRRLNIHKPLGSHDGNRGKLLGP